MFLLLFMFNYQSRACLNVSVLHLLPCSRTSRCCRSRPHTKTDSSISYSPPDTEIDLQKRWTCSLEGPAEEQTHFKRI